MKATAHDMVKALLEYSKTVPGGKGEEFLRDVQRELAKEIGEHENTVHVEIVTPSGDAGALKEKVTQMLQQKTGRPVEITERADPAMIGGAMINFGDEQIDLSVRGALQQAAMSIGTSALSSASTTGSGSSNHS